jgi:hypothetical protein
MQKFLATMLSLITTALCFTQTRLHAAHATPLFHATREYRDATQYLSRVLTYHATLDPTQKLFLNQLIHSSQQLYAAAVSCPLNAGGPLRTEFRQTWSAIQILVQDLPWMIETLPHEEKQRVTPHCRQFLATFQTLAVQIELCDPTCKHYPPGGNLALIPPNVASQLLMLRAELNPFPQPQIRKHDRAMRHQADRQRLRVLFLSHQTLSPSEWQSQQSGSRRRSETPIRGENLKTGARLTRLIHPR